MLRTELAFSVALIVVPCLAACGGDDSGGAGGSPSAGGSAPTGGNGGAGGATGGAGGTAGSGGAGGSAGASGAGGHRTGLAGLARRRVVVASGFVTVGAAGSGRDGKKKGDSGISRRTNLTRATHTRPPGIQVLATSSDSASKRRSGIRARPLNPLRNPSRPGPPLARRCPRGSAL